MNHMQTPSTTDLQQQLEALQARLAADQDRNAAQQGTALQQVGRRVDELAAQFNAIAQVGAQQAQATGVLERVEAQLQGLAAAQEQHSVQLQALSTSTAATATASQSDGNIKQVTLWLVGVELECLRLDAWSAGQCCWTCAALPWESPCGDSDECRSSSCSRAWTTLPSWCSS